MLKSLFCEDISAEYEYKSEKFKGVSINLKLNTLDLSGNTMIQKITDAPTLTSIYIALKLIIFLRYCAKNELSDVFTSKQTVILRDGVCQNLLFQNIFGENFCTENLVSF